MPRETEQKIMLGHGSGGKMMHELIQRVFMAHFSDPLLAVEADAAVMETEAGRIAYTTDAYVVQPLFFAGGNIGKLSVCGTVNDLAAVGAEPLYISAAFIIEEGFDIATLERVVKSMADTARSAGVRIVCGDTKVVGRGQCDQLFITTSGVGRVEKEYAALASGEDIRPGDHVILSGTLGDHGMAVLAARNQLGFSSDLESDCAPLNIMVGELLSRSIPLRFMRDPTRGGLAAVLCEITGGMPYGIVIDEEKVPVRESVRGMCELYGFDPLLIANEGKMVIIVPPGNSGQVVEILRQTKEGRDSATIGVVSADYPGQVLMNTRIGGKRLVTMPAGEQLPRIC